MLDDGAIELKVKKVTKTDVVTEVVNGAILSERKGINLPNTQTADSVFDRKRPRGFGMGDDAGR